ncbi:hypothetical protein GCM10020255_056500 [Rhodococcus baikonurensis]
MCFHPGEIAIDDLRSDRQTRSSDSPETASLESAIESLLTRQRSEIETAVEHLSLEGGERAPYVAQINTFECEESEVETIATDD